MADHKNDIDKYLKGELTPSEMHALEKKALSDPFLADALEGAASIAHDHMAADIKNLQASLAERVKGNAGKVIPFWVWTARIAAGLLLIAISTFTIITLTKNEPSEDLAVNKEINPAPTTTPEGEKKEVVTADSSENTKDLLSLAKPEKPKSKSPTVIREEPLQDKDDASSTSQAEAEESPQPAAAPKTDEVQAAPEIIEGERIAQAVPQETLSQGALKKSQARRYKARAFDADKKEAAGASVESQSDKAANSRIVKGKVISEDASGLPGVNVLIKGTNIGTVTDAYGNYQINLDQQNSTLVFSFIGFMSTEAEAGQKDELDVQLSEDVSQLSEVVVVGYGAETKSDDDLTSNLEMAAPAGGRKAFKQYLEKNMKYPEQALENKVEGKVTVQFAVESNGRLSDFRVIRGIGNGCDEEVIRLIKEGPKWSPTKRNDDSIRDRVKVRMKFELPEK